LLPTLQASDVDCRDAMNAWSCVQLTNRDSEKCCWCGGSSQCLAVSQNCSLGRTCSSDPAFPGDPCANASALPTCGRCLAAAGCGWCAPTGVCGSGSVAAPFAFAAPCADSANNWYVGTCPAANSFYGVPLPAWFSLFTACIILVAGVGMTFAGYRLFRIAIVLVGVAASGVPVFLLAWNAAPDGGTFSLSTAVLAGCVGATLGGFLCWRLFRVGVFIMGASLGVILALLLHLLVFVRFLASYGNTFLITAAVLLGLGIGALGLRFMRKTMVVATSTLGAYAAIRGVSLFVPGSFLSELTLAKRLQDGATLPVAMDGYLGGIGALALAGMLVQFLLTARKLGKGEAKDELELELEESELSLEALQGECRVGSRRVAPSASLTGKHTLSLSRTHTHTHAHAQARARRKRARRRASPRGVQPA
jgi:hypothetical protein